jgi:hypothetical protein
MTEIADLPVFQNTICKDSRNRLGQRDTVTALGKVFYNVRVQGEHEEANDPLAEAELADAASRAVRRGLAAKSTGTTQQSGRDWTSEAPFSVWRGA